jgi:hypothetical protein
MHRARMERAPTISRGVLSEGVMDEKKVGEVATHRPLSNFIRLDKPHVHTATKFRPFS